MTTRPSGRTRVPARTASGLVALVLAALAGLGLSAPAHADTSGTTIDHSQVTPDGLKLLVSIPPGTDAVDFKNVTVTIGGTSAPATAESASTTNDISRTSILAIDTSDSMRGARINEAKAAALTYLKDAPANVQVGVLTFDDRVKVLVPPTLDRTTASTAINALTLTRNTALYDGVMGALTAVGPDTNDAGQRRILVLSDGKDTTGSSLAKVLSAIKQSGVKVDAVALAQSDSESGPLRQIAAAGKGTVLNAAQPAALTAAFKQEADVLSRQVLVTATVPAGVKTSSSVAVSVPVGSSTATASAFLQVKNPTPAASVDVTPKPVTAGRFSLPTPVVFGGVGAIAVGLLVAIVALALGKPAPAVEDRVAQQMAAYGVYATTGPGSNGNNAAANGQMSIASQARLAAEKALSNNRGLEARVATKLEAAGMALKPAEWLMLRGGIAVVGVLLGVLLLGASPILGVVLIIAALFVPPFYLRFKRSSRLKAFAASLPDTLQLMSGSLSAGLSLAQSIDTIVREGTEPITSEFKRVVVEGRLGVPLEDSLEGVADRMESRDFEWVVMAIRIQREVGGNLAELLLSVADTLREREYVRRHVRALSAEGRLSCYVLGGLPPGFLLYLAVSKPDYVHPMFTTPIGWMMCAGMAVLLGVGVFWMSKVAKVDF